MNKNSIDYEAKKLSFKSFGGIVKKLHGSGCPLGLKVSRVLYIR